jgi:nucleoside-diphosphate-sugar epimerase
MKIVITGAIGFLGGALSQALSRKHDVTGISRKGAGPAGSRTILHDITSPDFPRARADAVLHMAALTDLSLCESDPAIARKINVEGTRNTLEFAVNCGAKKFVYASSGGVYGSSSRPFSEDDEPSPDSTYARTKLEGERLCERYQKHFDVTAIRYFFPYGPGNGKDRLMERLSANIEAGRPVTINRNGGPVLNPVYISDAVSGTILAMEKCRGFTALNLAGPEALPLKEISAIIGRAHGKDVAFKFHAADKSNIVGDTRKAGLLGYDPKVRLAEGIRLTLGRCADDKQTKSKHHNPLL